jgi:hypothetical protein
MSSRATTARLKALLAIALALLTTLPPLSRASSVSDGQERRFSAPIIGFDGTGTCSLSYRILGAVHSNPESTRVVWACNLRLPGFDRPNTGVASVGGNLSYELLVADSVVAAVRTPTGPMTFGTAHAFGDTLTLATRYLAAGLVPRWRLMCHGVTQMLVIQCGAVAPEDR